MKAKDTLIDEMRMHSILSDESDKPNRSIIQAMKQLGSEQAEISFKTGRKEVVDWIENNSEDVPTECFIEGSNIKVQEPPAKYILGREWQSKLKEWGLDALKVL